MISNRQLYIAIELANNLHKDQVDKGGNPYILHPLAVMNKVETIKEKIVAILHDILEDTPMKKEGLLINFDEEIVDAIETLTKIGGQTWDEYIEQIKGNELARKVKIADLEHNMNLSRLNRGITKEDKKRYEKYRAGKEKLEDL